MKSVEITVMCVNCNVPYCDWWQSQKYRLFPRVRIHPGPDSLCRIRDHPIRKRHPRAVQSPVSQVAVRLRRRFIYTQFLSNNSLGWLEIKIKRYLRMRFANIRRAIRLSICDWTMFAAECRPPTRNFSHAFFLEMQMHYWSIWAVIPSRSSEYRYVATGAEHNTNTNHRANGMSRVFFYLILNLSVLCA